MTARRRRRGGRQRTACAVQSAVGLFVELPLTYQAKIEQVAGVEKTSKFQWFGGYYRSQKNFFAQFAVDPETMFDMYPEMRGRPGIAARRFLDEPHGAASSARRSRSEFDWKVGDTIPIIGALYPHPDGRRPGSSGRGIYRSRRAELRQPHAVLPLGLLRGDARSRAACRRASAYVDPAHGARRRRAGGDRATSRRCSRTGRSASTATTEAEFQRQFVTRCSATCRFFVGWIGGGVLIAILLACINTMLMAMREQTPTSAS